MSSSHSRRFPMSSVAFLDLRPPPAPPPESSSPPTPPDPLTLRSASSLMYLLLSRP
ncbi:unnamed protein product [Arabidopsis thaliana]|uniref:Uncharacterized protein n=1 Tax=Arabidopsis thaliana TaxID=3702 RepID=A0A5S9WLP2_ARATH|nr:unnamed protein product [Arabidopsis thaliana]